MLGYVSYMRADTASGLGVVALASGFGGAWWLGEAVRAVAAGREPAQLDLTPYYRSFSGSQAASAM